MVVDNLLLVALGLVLPLDFHDVFVGKTLEEDGIFEDRNPTAAAYKHDQSEREVWGDPNLPGDRWFFQKDQGSDFQNVPWSKVTFFLGMVIPPLMTESL